MMVLPAAHWVAADVFDIKGPGLWSLGGTTLASLLSSGAAWLIKRHGMRLIEERRNQLMHLAMMEIAVKAFETGKPVLGRVNEKTGAIEVEVTGTVSKDGKVKIEVLP
jgi:hypothetical protein